MIDEILLQIEDEKTMKALTTVLGEEGWREPWQKESSQEPDLMSGKHIGLWQLRRKKFFFSVSFLMGIK